MAVGEGRLAGRAALITGAADGIGQGMARRFAKEGAALLVVDFDADKGEETVRQLEALSAPEVEYDWNMSRMACMAPSTAAMDWMLTSRSEASDTEGDASQPGASSPSRPPRRPKWMRES